MSLLLSLISGGLSLRRFCVVNEDFVKSMAGVTSVDVSVNDNKNNDNDDDELTRSTFTITFHFLKSVLTSLSGMAGPGSAVERVDEDDQPHYQPHAESLPARVSWHRHSRLQHTRAPIVYEI